MAPTHLAPRTQQQPQPAHDPNDPWTAVVGDCLPVMDAMTPAAADVLITDPPYGLSDPPPVEDVIAAWSAGRQPKTGRGGFMDTQWDAFVPGPWIWAQASRVCASGAWGAVFASPRTLDWMCLSLQLGGWTVCDVWHWCYAEGFPTGAVVPDKLRAHPDAAVATNADRWAGWVSKLKPAHEPIIIVRNSAETLAPNMAAPRWLYTAKAPTRQRPSGFVPVCGHPRDVHDPLHAIDDVFSDKARRCGECGQPWQPYQHPTVKPVDLIGDLVEQLSEPEALILDPYAGTGTTAQAAGIHQRRAVLIERSPVHVGLIHQRLSASLQPMLFPDLAS